MAKVASIVFLLAFGWYSVGFIMHARMQVRAIKREMRSRIRSGDIRAGDAIELAFSLSDFKDARTAPQLVNDHEFQWNGSMYDVVGAYWQANSLVVKCIPDNHENDLLAWFIHFVKDHGSHQKKYNSGLAFSFGHFGQAQRWVVPACPAISSLTFRSINTFIPSSHFGDVPAPPPWRCA